MVDIQDNRFAHKFYISLVSEILPVMSRDYIFYFSQWYATVLLIFAPNSRRKPARQGCRALIYLNEYKNFYSRNQQSLKFILIYNLNLNLSFFIFIYELDRFDRCSEQKFLPVTSRDYIFYFIVFFFLVQ